VVDEVVGDELVAAGRERAHGDQVREGERRPAERARQARDLGARPEPDDADAGGVGVRQQATVERRRAAAGEAELDAARAVDDDGALPAGGPLREGVAAVRAERGVEARRQPRGLRRGRHERDGEHAQHAGVREPHGPEQRGQAVDRALRQRRRRKASGAVRGERRHAGRGRGRRRDGDEQHPEGRDGLVREHADAEACAVAGRPERQRQRVVPALGHLPAPLRDRKPQEARLARGREQREHPGGSGERVRGERAAGEPGAGAERGAREHRREPEEGEGGEGALGRPAHGGTDRLDHRDPSGRPGARDAREEPCRDEHAGQHGIPVSRYVTQKTRRSP
jgi:hypothetical protein